jgi:hypothetical protein
VIGGVESRAEKGERDREGERKSGDVESNTVEVDQDSSSRRSDLNRSASQSEQESAPLHSSYTDNLSQ